MKQYALIIINQKQNKGEVHKEESYPFEEWFRQHAEIAQSFVKGEKDRWGNFSGLQMVHEGKIFPDPRLAESVMRQFFDRVRSISEVYFSGPSVDTDALSKWAYITAETISKAYHIAAQCKLRNARRYLEDIASRVAPELEILDPTSEAIERVKLRLSKRKSLFRRKKDIDLLVKENSLFLLETAEKDVGDATYYARKRDSYREEASKY